MESNTINFLNTKPWYRAVKVLYIIFAVFSFSLATISSVAIALEFYENRQAFNKQQSEINEKINEINKLKEQGYKPPINTDQYKIGSPKTLTFKEFAEKYGEEGIRIVSQDLENSLPSKPLSLYWLILIIPGSFLAAWLAILVPKWIFYYIYFGTIKPKKINP